jgi:hypothetical protein
MSENKKNISKELGESIKKLIIIKEWEELIENLIRPRYLLNRIKTPDGTILTSRYTHDYVSYIDKNRLEYSVDGGLDYLSRSCPSVMYEELSVSNNDPFEKIRESLEWGSYGKYGNQPLHWIPICMLTDNHIRVILENRKQGNLWFREYLYEELQYRIDHNITIQDNN